MNLLIIHTDQLSSSFLSCYSQFGIDTPNIDSLANEGAIFNNFYTNSAVCTPSRGCLLTGRYPHEHGAYQNNLCLNNDEITFAQVLSDNGYDTGYVGKWHLDGARRLGYVHETRGFGFKDNRYMFNRGHYKKVVDNWMEDTTPNFYNYDVIGDEKTYLTDWLTRKTIDYINTHANMNFCHMLSIPDPHNPYTVRAPYDSMYSPDDMIIPESFHDILPKWFNKLNHADKQVRREYDKGEKYLKETMTQYCGMIKLIDDSIGRIITTLKTNDIYDKTIVVFTSDHGDYMGDHGLYFKNAFLKTAYNIPLIIRYPEKIQNNTVINGLCSTVDFQSTILSLMGYAHSGRESGKDVSKLLLHNNQYVINDEIYFYHSHYIFTGIMTEKYHFGMFKNNEYALYDMISDNAQRFNLANSDEHIDVINELKLKIQNHHRQQNTPNYEWIYE